MLNTVFIVATWLIGIFGIGGACAAVAAVVLLGPGAFVAIVQPMLVRFIECTWCVVVVVFVLSTTTAYWVGRHGEYARGHAAAIAEIAAEDAGAIAEATKKRGAWKDCRASGRQWDQATGECQ